FGQRAFDFYRRDPLARDAEHVVGPAGVPEVAVVVHRVFVAGEEPAASHAIGGEVAAIPVAGGSASAGDEQIADDAAGDIGPFGIGDPDFVARDGLARAAWLDSTGAS